MHRSRMAMTIALACLAVSASLGSRAFAQQPTGAEAEIHELVSRYYQAVRKEDVGAFVELHSASGPAPPTALAQAAQQTFELTDTVVRTAQVEKISVHPGKALAAAFVRVEADVYNQDHSDSFSSEQDLVFVTRRENGGWKILRVMRKHDYIKAVQLDYAARATEELIAESETEEPVTTEPGWTTPKPEPTDITPEPVTSEPEWVSPDPIAPQTSPIGEEPEATAKLLFVDDFSAGMNKWDSMLYVDLAWIDGGMDFSTQSGNTIWPDLLVPLENIVVEFEAYSEGDGFQVTFSSPDSLKNYSVSLGAASNTRSMSFGGDPPTHIASKEGPIFKPGQWSSYRILREGDTFDVYCDDQPILVGDCAGRIEGKGHIHFSSFESTISLDNVFIFYLGSPTDSQNTLPPPIGDIGPPLPPPAGSIPPLGPPLPPPPAPTPVPAPADLDQLYKEYIEAYNQLTEKVLVARIQGPPDFKKVSDEYHDAKTQYESTGDRRAYQTLIAAHNHLTSMATKIAIQAPEELRKAQQDFFAAKKRYDDYLAWSKGSPTPSPTPEQDLTAAEAYQAINDAYDAMAKMMNEGKGDTPEGQEAYNNYKKAKSKRARHRFAHFLMMGPEVEMPRAMRRFEGTSSPWSKLTPGTDRGTRGSESRQIRSDQLAA